MMKASRSTATRIQKTIQTASFTGRKSWTDYRGSFVGMCVVYSLASQRKESRFFYGLISVAVKSGSGMHMGICHVSRQTESQNIQMCMPDDIFSHDWGKRDLCTYVVPGRTLGHRKDITLAMHFDIRKESLALINL